jgi:hypothetical protein
MINPLAARPQTRSQTESRRRNRSPSPIEETLPQDNRDLMEWERMRPHLESRMRTCSRPGLRGYIQQGHGDRQPATGVPNQASSTSQFQQPLSTDTNSPIQEDRNGLTSADPVHHGPTSQEAQIQSWQGGEPNNEWEEEASQQNQLQMAEIEDEDIANEDQQREAANDLSLMDEYTPVIAQVEEIKRNLEQTMQPSTPNANHSYDEILSLPFAGQLEVVRSSNVKDPTRSNYFKKIKRFLNWCQRRRDPEISVDEDRAPPVPFNPTTLTSSLPELLIQYLQTVVFRSCRTSSGFEQNVAALIA